MIKQLNMHKQSAHTGFSLNCYVLVTFLLKLPQSLMSCILNVGDIFRNAVDVTSSATRQRDSYVPAFIYTKCVVKVEPTTRKYFLRGLVGWLFWV